jgi:PKD repeat protein
MQKKMRFIGSYLILATLIGMLFLSLGMHVEANRPPISVPLPENQTIYAGDEAYFTGDQSERGDGNITSYFWDFHDGTNSTDINTSHTYNTPGNYSVTLEVTDDLGSKDNKSVNVTVLEAPEENVTVWIGSLYPDKTEYNVTEQIYVTISIEKDDGGEPSLWEGTLILEALNEDQDVVYYEERDIFLPDIMALDSFSFDFNLTESGEHDIRASLYDNVSVLVDQKEVSIDISDEIENQFPQAVANMDFEVINVTETLWFFGFLSNDPDGYIESYMWDFGDGNSSSLVNASHFYLIPGDYVITLTVEDNSDAENSTILTLSVIDPENLQPVAVLESSALKIDLGSEVWLYGHESYDVDGFITSYHWDFGDGNFSEGINISHVFTASGNYTVILIVKDDLNSQSSADITIEVVEPLLDISDEIVTPPPVRDSDFASAYMIGGFGVLAVLGLTFGTEAGKYRFFWLLIPLYTKLKKEEILDQFTRGKIYGYIVANPGDHFNSIKKALKLSDGSFAHHVHILEKEGIIKSSRDGTHRRFYPKEMPIPENGSSLKKSQLLIIDKIKEAPGISQKDIAILLGVSSPTVNYHLKELLKKEIIRGERAGMRMRYYVNPEEVKKYVPDSKMTDA